MCAMMSNNMGNLRLRFHIIREQFESIRHHFRERDAEIIEERFGLIDGEPKRIDYLVERYLIPRGSLRLIETRLRDLLAKEVNQ